MCGLLPTMIMAELQVYSSMHHLDLFLVESEFTKHVLCLGYGLCLK